MKTPYPYNVISIHTNGIEAIAGRAKTPQEADDIASFLFSKRPDVDFYIEPYKDDPQVHLIDCPMYRKYVTDMDEAVRNGAIVCRDYKSIKRFIKHLTMMIEWQQSEGYLPY